MDSLQKEEKECHLILPKQGCTVVPTVAPKLILISSFNHLSTNIFISFYFHSLSKHCCHQYLTKLLTWESGNSTNLIVVDKNLVLPCKTVAENPNLLREGFSPLLKKTLWSCYSHTSLLAMNLSIISLINFNFPENLESVKLFFFLNYPLRFIFRWVDF